MSKAPQTYLDFVQIGSEALLKASQPYIDCNLKSTVRMSIFGGSLFVAKLASCLAIVTGSAAAQPPSNIQASSWIAVDGESGQTLVEYNADTERQPASLTKLMTAYIVFDALKRGTMRWDEKLLVNAADIDQIGNDEAKMYLVPGQQVPVKKLVEGLIAASANDAALVLAERVGGSLAGFEQLMNSTARRLGMDHTHYSTPSGITTPGNYSTVRDLSTLALRITRDFPEYYVFSSEQHFAYGSFQKRNKNWLLGNDISVDGMKTGRTQAAGYCIVATAMRQQLSPPMKRRVFAILLGAPTASDRIVGAGSLLNYGFTAYKDYPIADSSGLRIVTRMSPSLFVQLNRP
ncbi:D-alanyl-D-alanine carboxypeptidase [Paraburkholderia sediminicola]|uniref:D-alanyl-D-alanine carboxypeptidase family protein n=1 Tax=Paraburkholderia sediminicola TaxID=458836 RepID=UPI0038B73BC5